MAKVYVFLANGFEDIEALIPIDVLRRGSVEVITVSTTDTDIVESAHGVGIRADVMFDDCDFSDADLLMLPASNLEKYLVRYSYWLLLLPSFVGSFIVADLLQYLVNWLSGHEGRMLVMQYLMSLDFNIVFPPSNVVPRSLIACIVLTFVWLHSCYAVGATFFRSHKHSWILTSVALIAFGIILGSLWPHDEMSRSISSHTAISLLRLWDVIYIFLIAFNYWLSYKFFCRQQVIGKYVNV